MTDETKTGSPVPKFTPKSDWLSTLLDKRCVTITPAVKEVKDADGKVTTRAKKETRVVNVEALEALARENHIEPKTYANPGMARMSIGNMLRAAARKRGGLFINERWTKAGEGFEVNDPLTEKRDGTKIAKAKAKSDAA